ncbi:MAG: YkvA family protein [Candidatus Hydrothermia bacterium]
MAEKKSFEGYLNFYKFFRRKISQDAERVLGKYGRLGVDVLLTAPDLFIFILRLYKDPEVSLEHKLALGAVLSYWLIPLDFLSEMFFGILGYTDDVFLAAYLLNLLIQNLSEEKIKEYWPGPEEVTGTISKILSYAEVVAGLMGKNARIKYDRLIKRIEERLKVEPEAYKSEPHQSPVQPTKINPEKISDFSIGLDNEE